MQLPDDRPKVEPHDAWLDPAQAAVLLGLCVPHVANALRNGSIPITLAPSGRTGVLKSHLLDWHRRDAGERRAALAGLAAAIDREVFG